MDELYEPARLANNRLPMAVLQVSHERDKDLRPDIGGAVHGSFLRAIFSRAPQTIQSLASIDICKTLKELGALGICERLFATISAP